MGVGNRSPRKIIDASPAVPGADAFGNTIRAPRTHPRRRTHPPGPLLSCGARHHALPRREPARSIAVLDNHSGIPSRSSSWIGRRRRRGGSATGQRLLTHRRRHRDRAAGRWMPRRRRVRRLGDRAMSSPITRSQTRGPLRWPATEPRHRDLRTARTTGRHNVVVAADSRGLRCASSTDVLSPSAARRNRPPRPASLEHFRAVPDSTSRATGREARGISSCGGGIERGGDAVHEVLGFGAVVVGGQLHGLSVERDGYRPTVREHLSGSVAER